MNKKYKTMDDNFIRFWKKYGPFFLILSGISLSVATKNIPSGILFIVLGIILMLDDDK
jgi:hypothetical protein